MDALYCHELLDIARSTPLLFQQLFVYAVALLMTWVMHHVEKRARIRDLEVGSGWL